MERDQDVWHEGWNGPRVCVFIELFPQKTPMGEQKDRAVVLFHGAPEIVEAKDLYEQKSVCFRSYGTRKQSEAMRAIQEAQRWLVNGDTAEADELSE